MNQQGVQYRLQNPSRTDAYLLQRDATNTSFCVTSISLLQPAVARIQYD